MSENKLGLSSPWEIFYREFEALFKGDPDIKLNIDDDNRVITLYVEKESKRDALSALLPAERTFGNVTVKIRVVPANALSTTQIELFQAAFEGNPAFAFAKAVPSTVISFGANYVVFKNKVVQFFVDDLGDINGLRSTLYQDIAEEIFGDKANVFFCTDIEEPMYSRKLGKPLGEWP